MSYCGQLVRDYDPDRYLLSVFEKQAEREALWALYAFNHEIAKTREVVSETALGQIRLKWWLDAIEGFYKTGEVLEHEVFKPLAQAIQDYNLPFEHFERLIYAREFDLEGVLPGNMEGLLNYIDFTNTPLLELSGCIAGAEIDMEPIRPIAINYGLIGLMRSIPYHARQGRCYLPEDMMKAAGLKKSDIYADGKIDALSIILSELLGQFVSDIQPEHPHLKRAQKLSEMYYRKIKSCGWNPYDKRMGIPLYFKEIRVVLGGLI